MKKIFYLIGMLCMFTLLCACMTEKNDTEKSGLVTDNGAVSVTNSVADTAVSTGEDITEKPTELEREYISLDSDAENQLYGAVDYVKRLSEDELLFVIWQNDNKEHLYIYNAQLKEMKDTGKTFNTIPSISHGTFREVIKPAMTQQLNIRLYDSDFNLDLEKQFSDPCIQINHYAVSDDSKSIALFDGNTVNFISLGTDETVTLQFKDNGSYHMENVVSFDDETCFIGCKAMGKSVFCITDKSLNPMKSIELDGEKAPPVKYDDFILVYEKSEIIPKKYGEATLIDKKTGETKTVKFTGQVGEGQNVTASDDGKYVMTSIVDQKSKNYDMPDNVYRIYDVNSGKLVYEKSFGFSTYGALYVYIDGECDKVYAFQYDMESGEKMVTIGDIA